MKNVNKKLNCLGIYVKEPTGNTQHKIRNATNTNDSHYMKKLHQPELHPLYSPSKITGMINEGGRCGHELKYMGDMENIRY